MSPEDIEKLSASIVTAHDTKEKRESLVEAVTAQSDHFKDYLFDIMDSFMMGKVFRSGVAAQFDVQDSMNKLISSLANKLEITLKTP